MDTSLSPIPLVADIQNSDLIDNGNGSPSSTTTYCDITMDQFSRILLNAIRGLLVSQEFSDVALACDEGKSTQSIPCHRILLSAFSPYLDQLLKQHSCDSKLVLYMKDMKLG